MDPTVAGLLSVLTGLVLGSTIGLAVLFTVIRRLETITDALAKGNASKGAYQRGWDSAQAKGIHDSKKPFVLIGHWHKGRWNPDFGLGPERRWQETFEVPTCRYYQLRWPEGCPDRNPFSADDPRRYIPASHRDLS